MAQKGSFKKGDKRCGRKKGSKNKIGVSVKEAIMYAYQTIGGDDAFTDWAREEKTEFYRMFSKLIPLDIQQSGDITITVNKMVDE